MLADGTRHSALDSSRFVPKDADYLRPKDSSTASLRILCDGNAPERGVFSRSVPTGNNYGQKALACFLEFAIRFPPDQLIEGGLDRVRRQTKLVPDTETHPRLAKQMSAVPKPGIDLAGRESACGRADERGKANAVRCTPSTSMQPTARMRTKPLLVPKPGIDGCGSLVGAGSDSQPGRGNSGKSRSGLRASRPAWQGRGSAVPWAPNTTKQPTARARTRSPAVPKPGINGCRSARCEPPRRTRPPRRGGLRQQQSSKRSERAKRRQFKARHQ